MFTDAYNTKYFVYRRLQFKDTMFTDTTRRLKVTSHMMLTPPLPGGGGHGDGVVVVVVVTTQC